MQWWKWETLRRRRRSPVSGEIEVISHGLMAFRRRLEECGLLVVIGERWEWHEEGCGGRRLVLKLVEERAGRLRTEKRGLYVDTFVEQHRRRRRLEGGGLRREEAEG
jgi:hypothetical protein